MATELGTRLEDIQFSAVETRMQSRVRQKVHGGSPVFSRRQNSFGEDRKNRDLYKADVSVSLVCTRACSPSVPEIGASFYNAGNEMPTYEFCCSSCGHRFELFLSISRKEKSGSFACPACGSADTFQVLSSVMIISKGSSTAGSAGTRSCSGPCPPGCKCG